MRPTRQNRKKTMPFFAFRPAIAAALLSLFPLLPQAATAARSAPGVVLSCTLLVDPASGQTLRREGQCGQRISPFSSFKIALAVMGYDAGILQDAHSPRWDYRPEFRASARQQKTTDPSIWLQDSIVWYSQQITRQLGQERFAAYVAAMDYGNHDVSGGPGKQQDGLTQAWLGSSLAVSADEQAGFLRRLLDGQLKVSPQAMAQARALVPTYAAADGWVLQGKTGSGWQHDRQGHSDQSRPLGWFVGWAEKDGRRIVFARMQVLAHSDQQALGLALREQFVKDWPVQLDTRPNTPVATDAPAASAPAQAGAGNTSACDGDGWNDPVPPRRIHGNTWYVGTRELSAILVTSPAGHVLLDGTTERSGPLVEANVRRLGFKLEDVRYILNSHAHCDHAGGIAWLQRRSGATAVTGSADAQALKHGGGDRSDPQLLITDKFPQVPRARAIQDGETLRVGSAVSITAHATPGHTPGSTSWSWQSCDVQGSHCLRMVYADSLTAYTDGRYRYSDDTAHPGALAAFRHSLASVAALPCDVLMTPHPSASQFWQRLDGQDGAQLVDAGACQRYAALAGKKLDEFVAQEAHKPVAGSATTTTAAATAGKP
jgi:metallo-beta-lactamase class B